MGSPLRAFGELTSLQRTGSVQRSAIKGSGLVMEAAAKRMTRKLTVVSPRDSLAKAKALMDSRNFRHVPVVEDAKLV